MKAELQRKLEPRAADLQRKASQFRHILPHSATLAETDAKLLLEAARALGMRDEDLDELGRRHVEGGDMANLITDVLGLETRIRVSGDSLAAVGMPTTAAVSELW